MPNDAKGIRIGKMIERSSVYQMFKKARLKVQI